jgi:hypothetical protein
MVAIGMLLAWGGYATASWGYLLVRGYDVKFTDWINPVTQFRGNPSKAGPIPPGQIFPGQNVNTTGGVPGENIVKPGKNNSCPDGYTYVPSVKRCFPPEASGTKPM